jgi:hypothetical protein
MTASREIKEGLQYQGVDEIIVYTLTTTPWGSSPGTLSVQVYSIASSGARTDVTATVMPSGSPSAVGDVISLPALKLLTAGVLYRVEVKFTCSGNVFEAYAYIMGEE